jgi:hypothetical protein
MSKLLSVVLSLVGFVILLGFQNCGNKPSPSDSTKQDANTSTSVSMQGTVQKATADQPLIDGCKILICAFDNVEQKQVCVIPVKWDTSSFKNGDTVSIQGFKRTDMVSTCMAGEIVQVTSAQVINQASAGSGTAPSGSVSN